MVSARTNARHRAVGAPAGAAGGRHSSNPIRGGGAAENGDGEACRSREGAAYVTMTLLLLLLLLATMVGLLEPPPHRSP